MKQRSRRRRSFPCMDISPWLPGTLDLRSKQGAVLYSLLESVLHSRLWLILPSIKTKLHLLVMGSKGRIAQVVLQLLEGFFALDCSSSVLKKGKHLSVAFEMNLLRAAILLINICTSFTVFGEVMSSMACIFQDCLLFLAEIP